MGGWFNYSNPRQAFIEILIMSVLALILNEISKFSERKEKRRKINK